MSKTRIILALALGAAVAALPARASEAEAKHPHHAATDKEERHEPAEGTQQHKMKTCNIEAGKKALKGDERRAFMSACLKSSS